MVPAVYLFEGTGTWEPKLGSSTTIASSIIHDSALPIIESMPNPHEGVAASEQIRLGLHQTCLRPGEGLS